MKECITARFGHGYVKLVRQVQDEEKTLAKMEGGGFIKKVIKDKVFTFKFIDVGKFPPPIFQFVDLKFGYNLENLMYEKLDLSALLQNAF
jgi:ATP-binding cassette subfamily F protein 2